MRLFSLRTFFTHCYQDILYTSEVYWMGWMGKSVRDRRVEFVIRASQGEGLSGLCREYEITRPTGYLWLRRFQQQGVTGKEERSRRPHVSPRQTSEAVEQRIVQLRRERPDWGARKLAVLLAQQGMMVPVVTVHRVLVRRGLVLDREWRRQATSRFEREQPNQLWQMDFKGPKGDHAAIGPLSVLDDHSRYVVGLEQTGSTRGEAVRRAAGRYLPQPRCSRTHADGSRRAVVERAGRRWLDAVAGVDDAAGRALLLLRHRPSADARQGRALPRSAGTGTPPPRRTALAPAGLAGRLPS